MGRRRLLTIMALALAAILAPFLYGRIEPARLWYEVIGVDVSHHQGDIDWRILAASGVDFAYIKATEGGDFRDPHFHKNWNGARVAGVLRGAYHFFTQCRTGADQAANFIRIVPKDAGVLPPMLDAEHIGPCSSGQQVADVRTEMQAFLNLVAAHYGKRAIVYVTQEFHHAYLDGQFAGETFWVRSLFWPPSVRRESWLFWQCHHRGARPGIKGPVELNAFRRTKSDLLAIAR